MHRVSRRQRLGQGIGEGGPQLLRHDAFELLGHGFQLEPEIVQSPHRHRPLVTPAAPQLDAGRTLPGVTPDQVVGERGALDAGAGHPEPVGEEPQRSGDRSPAAGHGGARHPRLLPVGGVLVDHEVEGHHARQQLAEAVLHLAAGVGKLPGERLFQRAIDRRHSQGDVLDRPDQHTAPLGPVIETLIEEVPRQSVDLAQVSRAC